MANVVATVPAGTVLTLLEVDGASKVGGINQWLRVRTPSGKEGFTAAWYLENPPGPTPASGPASPASGTSTTPPSTPTTPATSPSRKDDKLVVVVSSAVGASGLRLRKTASKGGALVAVLQAGTRLTVIEPAQKAKAKIGKANQWLYVRSPNNQRGYVGAEYVTLA
jgi:hypothetical protein